MYTKDNIGTLSEKINEESNKKLDKFINNFNKTIMLIPDWINNIENEKFKFKGRNFESVNGKIKVLIKKNVLFNANDHFEGLSEDLKISEFSIQFEKIFSYSTKRHFAVEVYVDCSQRNLQCEAEVRKFNKKIITDIFSTHPSFKLLNEKALYLYKLKDKKEKMLRGLTPEKKEIANSIFENYFFTINEKENESKFKEIEGLLLLTIDLKSKNKISRKESAKLL